ITYHCLPGTKLEASPESLLIVNSSRQAKSKVVFDKKSLKFEEKYFKSGRLLTSDRVELKTPRSFSFLGRDNLFIKKLGENLNILELESRYSEFIQSEFVVVGLPNSRLGTEIVFVTTDKHIGPGQFKHLSPSLIHPDQIIFVDEIDRFSNLKPNRQKISKGIQKK
ncbi:MAG: hypothetical protein AB8E15_03040, partial [Bdellovibrionales bacterium]